MRHVTVPAFSDYHVHFRQEPEEVSAACHATAAVCGRALAMPNLTPPITDAAKLWEYHGWLKSSMPGVDVLATFKLMPWMSYDDIDALADAGAVAGKIYPAGVTTHSSDGMPRETLVNPDKDDLVCSSLRAMERRGLVLCLHAEMPGQDDPLLREPDFLPFVSWLVAGFPKLRVVVEHVSTAEVALFVARDRSGRLAATVTPQHMGMHLGHLMGCATPTEGEPTGKLNPHLFCWPCLKSPRDMKVVRAMTFLHKNFFLGSDSAPHPVGKKEASFCCAGVFSAPVLGEYLVSLFDAEGALDRLEEFTSKRGDAFYGLPATDRTVTFTNSQHTVPDLVGPFRPMLAGFRLPWSRVIRGVATP